MDPNALLAEIEAQVNKILGDTQSDPTAERLAESVEDLFGWIAQGGFHPKFDNWKREWWLRG